MSAATASAKNDHRIKPKLNPEDFRDGLSGSKYDLVNQDPDVRYHWAALGENKEYLESIGYQVVIAMNGMVRPKYGEVVPGKPIMRGERGEQLILMGIHKNDHALIVAHGADGRSGQRRADEIDKLLGRGTAPGESRLIDPLDRSIVMQGHDSSAQVREN